MLREDELAPELRMQREVWKGDMAIEQDEKVIAEQIRHALQNRKAR
ncbi:MAG: hypothetical protein ABL931_05315 [Usitatibacteraceae bacterium]